eukprot:TsM_000210200 transcript=TsM_000210200 gene=TsM_000210200
MKRTAYFVVTAHVTICSKICFLPLNKQVPSFFCRRCLRHPLSGSACSISFVLTPLISLFVSRWPGAKGEEEKGIARMSVKRERSETFYLIVTDLLHVNAAELKFRSPMDSGETDLTGYGGAFDEDNDNNRYHHHHNDDGMCENDLGYDEVLDVDEGFVAFCGSMVSLFRLLLFSTTTPNYLPQIFEALPNTISMLLGIVLLRHFFGDLYVRPCGFSFNTMPRCTTACGSRSQIPTGWTSQMVFVTVCCLLLQLYWNSDAAGNEVHFFGRTEESTPKTTVNGFPAVLSGPVRLRFLFGSFGFESYLHATQLIGSSSASPLWKDLLYTATSFAIAIGCIIYSTYLLCASKWVHMELTISVGIADGQMPMLSRRVFDSIITLSVSSANSPPGYWLCSPHSSYLVSSPFLLLKSPLLQFAMMVINPVSIEVSRSLVDAIIHCYLPMHFWPKQCFVKRTLNGALCNRVDEPGSVGWLPVPQCKFTWLTEDDGHDKDAKNTD